MYNIKEIAALIKGEIKGNDNLSFLRLSPFFHSTENELTFAAEEKMLKNIDKCNAGAIIVSSSEGLPDNRTYIIVKNSPRELMPILLNYFKPKTKPFEKQIEISSEIDPTANVSKINTYIGHNVKIGKNTVIYPNVSIFEGSEIGDNCIVYSNVTIREFTKIGKGSIIQSGAVIGSDGFGFVKVNGNNMKIEQIGNVILEDEVEVGANTCIDRGTIGDTIIRKGTKIDNLVHIAHNDIIGENCFIVAQTGISGSVEVGNNTTLAGQVGVAGHLKIGNNVIIAGRSGVTNNVPDGKQMSGFPLREHMEDLRVKMSMGKVPDMIKKIRHLEKEIENLKKS
ncbi:MAG: UDP-3-O-(3-hydroxymyristoyl)glucosamine N-acyltransferase [Leptotrichiaceae bacterium]|nr:UDP-3-O-(3-hydroxymyristoyl)glucosamine N-acyltransferase [Leptotrichiaceae bacterium]